jgi:hypothetical protein
MEKIDLSEIYQAADTVAEYSDQQPGEEIFLGYEIVALNPVKAEAESDLEFEAHELFELTTATWSILLGQDYNTPETISRRRLRWTLTVQNLLNYKPQFWSGGYGIPEGDIDILEFSELIAVSSGRVPDVVVDALCMYLEENRGDYLAEDYAEAYKNNALPNWDPRILKIIKDACLKFRD